MSEQIIEKVDGSGEVVNPTHGEIKGAPQAHTSTDSPFRTHIRWFKDPRPKTGDDIPRSLDPYWEITEYTTEEFNAFLKADRLSPELAKRYKDYLED
jgi:hypothetical protein